MVPNWAKNILFLLVLMISGLILVIIIDGLTSGSELTPLNTVIEQVVMKVRTPYLTNFMVFVTRFGNPFVLASATALIAVIIFIKGRAYDAVLFVVSMIVAIIALAVLKNTFQITRPISDLVSVNGWSFPSGHATVATAFFFGLAHTFFGKLGSAYKRTLLILCSIFGAGVICFSRLYLGAHWTLDILAGIALGLLSVSLTVLLFNVFIDPRRSLLRKFNL